MAKKTVAPPAKAKKAAPAEAATTKTKSSRNVGVTSGLSIKEYQNQSLVKNEKAKQTDEQLAVEWQREFPKAMKYPAKMVKHVRNLFNKGKHGNDAPAKPLHGYDEDGAQIPNRGEGKAAKAVAKEAPAKAVAAGGKKLKFKKLAKAS